MPVLSIHWHSRLITWLDPFASVPALRQKIFVPVSRSYKIKIRFADYVQFLFFQIFTVERCFVAGNESTVLVFYIHLVRDMVYQCPQEIAFLLQPFLCQLSLGHDRQMSRDALFHRLAFIYIILSPSRTSTVWLKRLMIGRPFAVSAAFSHGRRRTGPFPSAGETSVIRLPRSVFPARFYPFDLPCRVEIHDDEDPNRRQSLLTNNSRSYC